MWILRTASGGSVFIVENVKDRIYNNCIQLNFEQLIKRDRREYSHKILYKDRKDKESCENCTHALKGNIKTNYTGWKNGE